MLIDRTNYELWLVDWLDGNLNEDQANQIQQFLSGNPDIREEFAELQNIRLNPPSHSYTQKNHLKKSAKDLDENQFEYLCTAFIENEITEDEYSDLLLIIKNDPDREKIFELFKRTKLIPPVYSFKQKNKLRRRTLGQNITRISIAVLTSAAVIAFGVYTYVVTPPDHPDIKEKTAQSVTPSSHNNSIINKNLSENSEHDSVATHPKSQKQAIAKNDIPGNPTGSTDTVSQTLNHEKIFVNKVPVFSEVDLIASFPEDLVESRFSLSSGVFDDGRSKISKFLARTFREKLLKEKTAKDSPLNGFEIAKAGVSGLNMLLGWEMTLDEKKNDNGELKSVYFSSKILKFNTPVKKSEASR